MQRTLRLLLLLLASGCSNQTPYATTIGILPAGATLTVRTAGGSVNAFHPASGQPHDRFTIAATAPKGRPQPAAPRLRPVPGGVSVTAADPLAELLVRVPDGVVLKVDAREGDVHVTDITGNANIATGKGDVNVMLPGYAQARTGGGNVSIRMGSTDWPGTLHVSTARGNVDVWIRDTASFHAHLHTDGGTIFTDFNLRGTSQGGSETIDGNVNGGGDHGIDIESGAGTVRLLQLHPQP